ncbi:hypothetical protein HDU80_002808, partial [Chytriomyces hyalinus]
IAKTIVSSLVDDVLTGKGLKASRDAVEQKHITRFKELERAFIAHQNDYCDHQLTAVGSASSRPFQASSLGGFKDKSKYAGFVPLAEYFSSVFFKYFETPVFSIQSLPLTWSSELKEKAAKLTREFYLHRRMQMMDGNIWSMDATFKVANLVIIRNANGTSSHPVNSIFIIMNEYEQVIFAKALVTNSSEELKGHLNKHLLHHRETLNQVLESLSDCDSQFSSRLADLSPNTIAPLPELELPDMALVHNITKFSLEGSDDGLKMVCEVLRRNAGKQGAIALDIEYNISQYGEKGRPPATLQLGTFKGHARHHFVGNYIQADLTRLQKHYHLDSSKVQWLDLAQHAISRGIQLREKGLAFLCRLFLKNHLPKGGVRISNWEGHLSEEQISYGTLDTYSSALIFEKMESIENPRYAAPPALESLVAGTKVMLFPKFSGDYLATGHVSSALGGTWGRYKLSAKAETRVVVMLESVELSGATVPFPKVPNESLQVYKPGDEILWSHKHIRLETPESVEWYRQKHEFENVLPGPSSFSDISAANFTTPSDEENFFPAVLDIVETLPVMDYREDEPMDLDTPANGIHVLQNGEWNILSEGTGATSMQDADSLH